MLLIILHCAFASLIHGACPGDAGTHSCNLNLVGLGRYRQLPIADLQAQRQSLQRYTEPISLSVYKGLRDTFSVSAFRERFLPII